MSIIDKVKDYFIDKNRDPEARKEETSPSGRYRLVIDSYGTKKGCWNYSRGRVYEGDKLIEDVMRNYSQFPFAWMEDHPNGHSYLICGADYQGQTFIELDTGKRKDFLPEAAAEGHGFCWVSHEVLDDGVTLLVEGCIWAGPYEYRLYDVSNPMNGWPQLKFPKEAGYLYVDEHTNMTLMGDGLIVWTEGDRILKETGERETALDHEWSLAISAVHKAKHLKEPQDVIDDLKAKSREAEIKVLGPGGDDDEDPRPWDPVIDHKLSFRREGDKIILVEEWKSEYEQEQDRQREEWRQEQNARYRAWEEGDVCYNALGERLEEEGVRCGWMFPSQVKLWDGEPNPAFFRIDLPYDREVKRPNRKSATIKWGVKEGPVIIEFWKYGKGSFDSSPFPRTPEGILDAWKTAHDYLAGKMDLA